jgi:hypothetical protein
VAFVSLLTSAAAMTQNLLPALRLQPENLARLAFGEDLERPAADFAIGRKPLRGDAGVNHQVEALAAIWALDGLADFHPSNLMHAAN